MRQTPGRKMGRKNILARCLLPGGRRWAIVVLHQRRPPGSKHRAGVFFLPGVYYAVEGAGRVDQRCTPCSTLPCRIIFFAGQCSCFLQSDPRGPALRNSTSETAAGKAAATHPTDESGRPDRADLPGGSDAPEAVPTGLREPICPTEPTGPIEPIHATDPTEPSEWGHCRR